MEKAVGQIAREIKNQLESGVRLTPGMLHYLESVLAVATAGDLHRQLARGDTSETGTLLELVFFPDESVQIRLEPLLEGGGLDEDRAEALRSRLCDEKIHTRLYFPDNTATQTFRLPGAVVDRYVRRLNLARKLDPQVTDAICRHLSDRKQGLCVRVRLRNCRFAFQPNIVAFLCAFLAAMPPGAPDYMDCLDLGLELLEGAGPQADIYDVLMHQKRVYAEMIRRAREGEKRLRHRPIEALIMQGTSISCVSEDATRSKMARIDEIALRVYGKTEMPELAEQPVTLGF